MQGANHSDSRSYREVLQRGRPPKAGVRGARGTCSALPKVKSSEADSVITGNWGQDMTLLLKAAGDAGYNLRYFNHSAGSIPGTVLAVSQAKQGQLTWVAEWHPGQAETPKVDALAKTYKTKTGKDFLAPRIEMTPRFLAAAINKAQSTDPVKVARAL